MSDALTAQRLEARDEAGLAEVRKQARAMAVALGFSLVNQTKIITAVSELARNMVIYGGGGEVTLEPLSGARRGMRITCADRGPGIADLARAMRDGFTSGHGLGLGLGGAKRLMHAFEIDSAPGAGTRVRVTRWA